ncbi:TPA: hypothetical protein MXR76_002052 [Pseudomonas aeruginosa]|uniref:hypothetical protein n=1 Tax=Pseudomonas aeruginosa TaxID=287 RepID=UPI00093CAE0F|nr:hypothetical protein [Pseudomonas aeruginosa]EKF7417526.1 hypothetical protein [Pseudomonas aeruginosa]MDS9914914.1 hypothetical protein [Pseudomonas aeruginosa]HBO1619763.1 hypothetical protein [Pseudomonas aeruginosa]HCA5864575.1 hypothetical protein [Pseudomonas aeruginosa]HCA7379510.1 hypothetical protein [Pseudomonas aeruginosa]
MTSISINLDYCCKFCLRSAPISFAPAAKLVPLADEEGGPIFMVPVCQSHADDCGTDGEEPLGNSELARNLAQAKPPREVLLAPIRGSVDIPDSPDFLALEIKPEVRTLVFKLVEVAAQHRLNAVTQTYYQASWLKGDLVGWSSGAEEASYDCPEINVSENEFWFTAIASHTDDVFRTDRIPVSALADLEISIGKSLIEFKPSAIQMKGGENLIKALGSHLMEPTTSLGAMGVS